MDTKKTNNTKLNIFEKKNLPYPSLSSFHPFPWVDFSYFPGVVFFWHLGISPLDQGETPNLEAEAMVLNGKIPGRVPIPTHYVWKYSEPQALTHPTPARF